MHHLHFLVYTLFNLSFDYLHYVSGDVPILFEFSIQALLHAPRQHGSLPDFMSSFPRVNKDTIRAMELAALLDEDRKVPEESRLTTILNPDLNPDISRSLSKPTDKLDIAIAYLRRVHFVTFYGGKRYRDEAHLLAIAPSLMCRCRPCNPTFEEIAIVNASGNATGVYGNESVRSDKVEMVDGGIEVGIEGGNNSESKKRKLEDEDDEGEEGGEDNEESGGKRPRSLSENEKGVSVSTPAIPPGEEGEASDEEIKVVTKPAVGFTQISDGRGRRGPKLTDRFVE